MMLKITAAVTRVTATSAKILLHPLEPPTTSIALSSSTMESSKTSRH